jgi:hypothetical protein
VTKRFQERRSKAVEQEIREPKSWSGVGFVVIAIGAVIAALFVLLGSA